jgi:hypothetical protein
MSLLIMAMTNEQVEEKLVSVERKVSTILDLIAGNNLNKDDKGIVGKVVSHDDRLDDLEKWRDRLVWTVIGMGLPASVGIWEILRKIILKN